MLDGNDRELVKQINQITRSSPLFEKMPTVEVRYREGEDEDIFSVPLMDINPIDVDDKTAEAIADWNYWVGRGYEFSE